MSTHTLGRWSRTKLVAVAVIAAGAVSLVASAVGCVGPAGDPGGVGPQGPAGKDGDAGSEGPPGQNGDSGQNGHNAYLTGPGLSFEVQETTIDAGVAKVRFRITDAAGTPLDREGLYTEGAVTARFVMGWLAEDASGKALQYTSYTIRTQTSPITNQSADQAAADEGGTFEEVDALDGVYAYTFNTAINVADGTKTHTLGYWAYRDFEGSRYMADGVFHFLPAGGQPSVLRDVVETASCNGCHNPLSAHGGQRRDVELCVLCHSPQTVDPDTGNTVDFPVMVHKIHRGKALPSVVAGTPYQIIGFQQSVHDYSTVGYPQELQNCNKCHTGAQGDNWKNKPSRVACSSCHDLVSFDDVPAPGTIAHAGGPQPDDTKCNVCHPPAGGLEGIESKHMTPLLDPMSPKLAVSIVTVEKSNPGQKPEIVFDVTVNGAPVDILAAPLTSLRLTVAGPTTDYASFWQNTVQGSGASGTLTAEPGQQGRFRYASSTVMPAASTGTYAFGFEGYMQASATAPRYAAKNPVAFAAVTDPAPVPRRTVVDDQLCSNCHYQLSAHGGQRNDAQYCLLCHNPNKVNDQRVSRFEGQSVVAQSVDLSVMVHRIHMGEELTQQPYILGGFPAPSAANPAGTPIDFGEVRYPGDRKACWACHAGPSYTLPLAQGLLPPKTQLLQCMEDPAADANAYCDNRVVASETPMWPEAAACTGCHDAPHVIAHVQTNTTMTGLEACATCHGAGAEYDVNRVHAPAP